MKHVGVLVKNVLLKPVQFLVLCIKFDVILTVHRR